MQMIKNSAAFLSTVTHLDKTAHTDHAVRAAFENTDKVSTLLCAHFIP